MTLICYVEAVKIKLILLHVLLYILFFHVCVHVGCEREGVRVRKAEAIILFMFFEFLACILDQLSVYLDLHNSSLYFARFTCTVSSFTFHGLLFYFRNILFMN